MPPKKKPATTTPATPKARSPRRAAHIVLTDHLQKTMKYIEETTDKVTNWGAGTLADDLRGAANAISNALGCLADLPEDFHPGKPGLAAGTMVTVKEKFTSLYEDAFDVTAPIEIVSAKNSHLTCKAIVDEHEIRVIVSRRHVESVTTETETEADA